MQLTRVTPTPELSWRKLAFPESDMIILWAEVCLTFKFDDPDKLHPGRRDCFPFELVRNKNNSIPGVFSEYIFLKSQTEYMQYKWKIHERICTNM